MYESYLFSEIEYYKAQNGNVVNCYTYIAPI